jgi:hypothetical protein
MVSKDWKTLSKFKEWYDNNYVEGWHLDKDILVKGSKLYSPETCCFVPEEINSALIAKSSKTGLPIGVYFKKRNGKFCAQMSVCNNGVRESGYIGLYATVEAAFSAYKAEKEKYIQSLAEKHKTALAANAYEALVNWNVEITD